LAKRYARALFSVARDEKRLEEVASELASLAAWLRDEELSEVLTSPILARHDRRALIAQVAGALGLSDPTRNFLGLVTEQGRLDSFAAMQSAYADLVDGELDRLRAILRTARPLSDAAEAEIASTLEAQHGKKILLAVEVDPSLVAGITVEIEGKTYDGSARTQLARVARTMARPASDG